MARWAKDSLLDLLLNAIKTDTVTMVFNTTQPADRSGALSDALASVSMSSSDFTVADASPDGRKVTVAAKTGIAVDASGTVGHVSLISSTDLLFVTVTTSQALVEGNEISTGTWTIRVSDPKAES